MRHLLTLPAEIRSQIWDMALTSTEIVSACACAEALHSSSEHKESAACSHTSDIRKFWLDTPCSVLACKATYLESVQMARARHARPLKLRVGSVRCLGPLLIQIGKMRHPSRIDILFPVPALSPCTPDKEYVRYLRRMCSACHGLAIGTGLEFTTAVKAAYEYRVPGTMSESVEIEVELNMSCRITQEQFDDEPVISRRLASAPARCELMSDGRRLRNTGVS